MNFEKNKNRIDALRATLLQTLLRAQNKQLGRYTDGKIVSYEYSNKNQIKLFLLINYLNSLDHLYTRDINIFTPAYRAFIKKKSKGFKLAYKSLSFTHQYFKYKKKCKGQLVRFDKRDVEFVDFLEDSERINYKSISFILFDYLNLINEVSSEATPFAVPYLKYKLDMDRKLIFKSMDVISEPYFIFSEVPETYEGYLQRMLSNDAVQFITAEHVSEDEILNRLNTEFKADTLKKIILERILFKHYITVELNKSLLAAYKTVKSTIWTMFQDNLESTIR